MNSDKYSIIFIMDESGSMVNMGNEPWQGLNNFVNKQKENNIEFNFTLIFFNQKFKLKMDTQEKKFSYLGIFLIIKSFFYKTCENSNLDALPAIFR